MRGIARRGIVVAAVRLALLGMPVMVIMVIMAVTAAPVTAQSGFFNANGGQLETTDFADTVDFTLFAEDGDFMADYQVAAVPLFDVSVGAMLGRFAAVGVGVGDVPVAVKI